MPMGAPQAHGVLRRNGVTEAILKKDEIAALLPVARNDKGGLHGKSQWNEAHPTPLSSEGLQLEPGRRQPSASPSSEAQAP